jgi:hypothetical protein
MKKLTIADIPVRDYSIDDLPNLKASLGKAKVDKIRYATEGADSSKLANSKNVQNTIRDFMQDKEPGEPGCWVDDIIQGVARLDHQVTKHRSPPMSVTRLYSILQCIELINTRELMKMLNVDKRQAQKYMKACQLIITAVEKHLNTTEQQNPPG